MTSVGKSLIQGAKEALEYAEKSKKLGRTHQVEVPEQIDVKAIRKKLHLSRMDFSRQFGFSPRTLEKWEQGVRQPDGAARAYLTVISRNPKGVARALAG